MSDSPIYRREHSEGSIGSSIKKPKKLVPGLDYGHELLANAKFTPPSSPLPSEAGMSSGGRSRTLNLDELLKKRSRSRSRKKSREPSHISISTNKIPSRPPSEYRKSRESSRRKRGDRHDDYDRRKDTRSRSRSRKNDDIMGGMPMLNESDYQISEGRDRIDMNLNDIILEESEHGNREKDRKRDRSRDRSRDRDRSKHDDRDRDRSRHDDRDRDRSRHDDRDRDRSRHDDRRHDDRDHSRHDDERDRSKHDDYYKHDDYGHGYDYGAEHGDGGHHLLDDELEQLKIVDENPPQEEEPDYTKLSPKEIMKRKRKSLLHIKIMEKQGYEPFKEVGLTNPLEEIFEVEEEQIERRSLTNGIEFGKKILVGGSYVVESLNRKFDPFDLKLDGWSDQMFEDKDEYNEVMEELYYKYSDQVAMSPEIKLLMMVGGSAMMFHFSKALMSSGNLEVPNFDSIMTKNPELKRAYEQAAMNHMMDHQSRAGGSQQAPNMVSGILGSMTGDPNMGNALNAFMSTGGAPPMGVNPSVPPEIPNRKVHRSPPTSRVGGPIRRGGKRTGGERRTGAQMQEEIEIIPPADPDNILGGGDASSSSGGRRRKRTTRSQRDNLTKLVV